ncbi:HAMP domain-containing histidine kinase [Ruminococcaceae bacterium OttesenSCG-928-N02]|nr:HAMP domain-containing histidine kinase [Ruminococcaceae bacterium OttesenSCG-928-N02]
MYNSSNNLTNRYFKTTAGLLLVSAFLLGVSLMFFAQHYFQSDRQKVLASSVLVAAELLESNVNETGYVNRTTVNAAFSLISKTTDSIVFLAQSNGQVILCSEGAECTHMAYTVPRTMIETSLTDGLVSETGTLSGIYNTRYYTIGIPAITTDGDLIGIVFASSSLSALSIFLNDLLSMFLLSTGFMLFISSILSVWLSQRLSQPLRVMANAARSYGQGDFSVRVPTTGDNEIAQLALTFNNMAQDLQLNEESRSAFIDNIAHELRTPMTTIKGFVDGILDGTIPTTQQNRYLQIVSQEVGRLSRLTSSMLDISRLENDMAVQTAEPNDVWESIVAATLAAEQRIEAKNIRIEGLVPARTMVLADPGIVHQVVYNLVDNAIKFTPVGGAITFSVAEAHSYVFVSIMNTGEGIAPDDLPHVFDRFYKADKSRGLHTTGSGLGLYICKKMLNQSGGDIMVRSKRGEFAQFTFSLPSAPKEKPTREKETRSKPKTSEQNTPEQEVRENAR